VYYIIRNRKISTWAETSGGVVESAGKMLAWAVGKKMEEVVRWAGARGYATYIAETETHELLKLSGE